MQVILYSYQHYDTVLEGDEVVLRTHGEECPGMGERLPYGQEEGDEERVTEVARWHKDTEVTFLVHEVTRTYAQPTGKVLCADDLCFRLRR